ncbi:right-handed parallel beta-helix repeat-containing protein [Streptomyces tsukubensis]|uniref:Sheath polysaccharide-degrading enzyme n=1 Tax=Streptomyces tsukubensis TaxID=83656 RepID=A0A1V4A3N9_9ACTN|nr:right-handed parallel beta-helix repeat-containing protein [Streptomyces tsukubensis]OON74673.1 sheath polysaccharide-degrading enzyme [Streptomyces tsukubensis]QFR93056.1 sheath polysaccharide-degrading enzyme [Streptomyces tsukubensis]
MYACSPTHARPLLLALAASAALGLTAGAATAAPRLPAGSATVIEVGTASQLKAALTSARPGDTIHLADGTYTGNFKAYTAATADARITLTGSAGAVLRTSAGGGNALQLDGAAYWTVRGITLTHAQKGLMIDRAPGVTVDSVTVHDLTMEGVHFRNSSSDGLIRDARIYDTGQDNRGMGEGVYVGTANTLSDRSDRVRILDNTIGPDVRGEAVDLKEGTTGGRVAGNTFDGRGLTGNNYDDSWVDVKGNGYVIEGNTGRNTTNNGFEVHTQDPGWGCGTVFRANHADLTGPSGAGRYAIHAFNYSASCPTTVAGDNTVTGGQGLTNPGVPVG